MKKLLFISLAFMTLLSCTNTKSSKSSGEAGSIFFTEYDTQFGMPPFDKITFSDYKPAFLKGMEEQSGEIDAIAGNQEAPTFENTIAALDNSGKMLTRVSRLFYGLKSAETNDSIQALAEELSPLLSEHNDNIYLNGKLFDRIKTLHDDTTGMNLTTEQYRLLDNYYKDFVRSGIMLGEAEKTRLREINKELSALTLNFGNNLLNETNNFKLVIDNKDDLAGLPEGVIAAAAEAAKAAGEEGKWAFGLQKPSWLPFLQYSEKRDLREKLYKAMYNRGDNDNENDNKRIINDIVNLRIEKAQMLGYKTHADFILEENMAKTPANVYKLLNEVWDYALPQVKKEAAELQALIDAEGGNFKLESWDWWYYTEKLRQQKYSLNEEEIKPYFKMENVREGVFEVANRLYGLSFRKLENVPVYNPEVEAYEVLDADGSHVSVFYTDYFPRAGKNAGAWMSSFRGQQVLDGKNIRPLVYNVGNFTRPTESTPSLLTLDEVETLFHEFGHALHGMLSNVTYAGVSGTSVPRDFVELPSQIMEHWAFHPEVLKLYARHYQTGEVIPDELIARIDAASKFNMGFITTEFVAAALLDMDYHTQSEKREFDVRSFETKSMEKIGLIKEIIPRYRSTYFSHIFSGGYSAGYYAYLWAEVLDADAFQPFVEKGVFDKATATSFRENVLSKGNSDDPMVLYKKYRGAEPNPVYLLKNRGFVE
ncbi:MULTISPECIES: M3 family metallopeptidase [unclassified Proteiniphilum]|jgi:peptidyl-dipeptidase Dcp|uniref:M3 family metallopeptidase n=1 Tax=unclassified Proteiniphilum TaxID=2622718 RepID=UPI00257F8E5B|nr:MULTISPECIES: M3 family metallopeptidase [unclassified Proteiniphilum]